MHRATPSNSSFRGYSSGGSRVVVSQADDSKLMQEMSGNMMHNESRKAVEAPQNYGFTSVVADATQDSTGKITAGAETFMSFMGGNRSFPVSGNMDDRRHRLFNLKKGDTAMFSLKQRKQQLHMNADGGFWLAPRDKTVRMGLLDEDSEQDPQQQSGQSQSGQQQSGPQAVQQASGGTGSSGSSGGQQNGQQARYQDQQKTYRFMHCTGDETARGGNNVRDMLSDGQIYHEIYNDKFQYLGGDHGKPMALVVTVAGPCKNVKGRIG